MHNSNKQSHKKDTQGAHYNMNTKDNYNPPYYQSTVTFKGKSSAPVKYPNELTELLPEPVQNKLPELLPITTITKVENNETKLNPLGKEVVASVEGKLCELGQRDSKSVTSALFKASDFDGTLSYLVNQEELKKDPTKVKPIGHSVDHLIDLTLPNVKSGIITGRGINDLLRVIGHSEKPKYKTTQVTNKLFVSGLHGLEKLENTEIKANISSHEEEVLNKIRINVNSHKQNIAADKNKIVNVEDKKCAYAFHFNPKSNDDDRKEALKQALNIMKNSGAQVILPDASKGTKEKELAGLINENGVKNVTKDDGNNTNFKLIYGSGVLEMIPPGSNKGTVFTGLFNKYKESVAEKFPNAKIIASYSGDDTTDFDAFKAIMDLSQDERVEPAAVFVINNRNTEKINSDLASKIEEIEAAGGELTKIHIAENAKFLDGQNKLLHALDEHYKQS